MLKRLSFTSTTPLDSPTLYSTSPSNYQPNSFPFPQAVPNSNQPTSSASIEVETLHKTINTLSRILTELDDYKNHLLQISKSELKLSKLLNELGSGFTIKGGAGGEGASSDVIVGSLNASSSFFNALGASYSPKLIGKEYEMLNEFCSKGFKKLAKEEKNYEEALESLNSKVAKAGTLYEKSRPQPSRSRPSSANAQSLLESHNRYLSTLSNLTTSINQLKRSHSESIGEKREKMGKEVARVMAIIGELSWRNRIEGTKKGGEKIGEVIEKAVFCEVGVFEPRRREGEIFPSEESITHRPKPVQQSSYSSYNQNPTESTSLRPPTFSSQSERSISPTTSSPRSPHPLSNNFLPSPAYSNSPRPIINQQSFETAGSRPSSIRTTSFVPTSPLPNSPRPLSSFQPPLPAPSPRSTSHNAPLVSEGSYSPTEELRNIVNPPSLEFQSEEEDAQLEVLSSIMDGWNSLELGTREREDIQIPIHTRYEDDGIGTRTDREEVEGEGERDGDLRRNESTMSERSFVARMREKYAAEKEKGKEKATRGDPEASMPTRSNSRVANLAAKYSYSSDVCDSRTSRITPSRHQSQSVQPETFSSNQQSPPLIPFPQSAPQNYTRHSLPTLPNQPPNRSSNPIIVPTKNLRFSDSSLSGSFVGVAKEHSSVCACETCFKRNYGGSNNSLELNRDGDVQSDFQLKKARPGLEETRRFSMPLLSDKGRQ